LFQASFDLARRYIYSILVAFYGELDTITAINLPKVSPVFAVRRTVTSAPSLNDALSILCGLPPAVQYTYPRLHVHVYRSDTLRMTRIKNIKNVTRCRDSRSAKSIETR